MVKRLNAPRAGQYNASAIERLVRDSTGDILPIDATDTDQITGLADIATSGSASDLDDGTVPAARMPAHTGDVTSASGAVALTIANDAVTYAKMQNVSAASKLLGRGDSGSGDPQEITLGTGLSMSGTTLNGAAAYTDPWTYVKRTTLQSNTSTTLVTTDLSIAGSSLTTNTYYEFEALVGIKRSGGGGAVSIEFSWPTVIVGSVYMELSGTEARGDESGSVTIAPIPSTSVFYPLRIRGYLYSGGTQPGGTLDIKSSIASGTLSVSRGSFLKIRAFT